MDMIRTGKNRRHLPGAFMATLFITLLALSSPGQAQLVELDFALPGDGWVTRDTVNNLDY